jgi:hypothetical protein
MYLVKRLRRVLNPTARQSGGDLQVCGTISKEEGHPGKCHAGQSSREGRKREGKGKEREGEGEREREGEGERGRERERERPFFVKES